MSFACSGTLNSSLKTDFTRRFVVYLHEPDHFWPGKEMQEHIGQTTPIYIPPKTELRGSFTVVQKTNQAKLNAPCVSKSGYSFTYCVKKYVTIKAGCSLDWLNTVDQEPCVTWDQVHA